MTRRFLLWLLLPAYPPTDEQRLNKFAQLYNQYVEKLKEGLVDMPLWDEVVKAAAKLK
jgi:hypothetical protein